MPTYKTSQQWLDQSALLIKARPSTTRVTTRHSIKRAKNRPRKTKDDTNTDTPMADAKPPRGTLVFKTFDPHSGVTLKYRTTKAAEVSWLILALGRLARGMAALPEANEEDMADAPPAGAAADTGKEEGAAQAQQPQQQQQRQGQGQAHGQGSGGKKKKKGGKK